MADIQVLIQLLFIYLETHSSGGLQHSELSAEAGQPIYHTCCFLHAYLPQGKYRATIHNSCHCYRWCIDLLQCLQVRQSTVSASGLTHKAKYPDERRQKEHPKHSCQSNELLFTVLSSFSHLVLRQLPVYVKANSISIQ